MAKANITQYSSTPSSNTDINNINIDENCPASGLNNAIRELMAHLKNVDTGSQALTSPSFTAMSTDTISEKTSANGVAIDSVTLKDGELGTTASPVPINSSSLNGGQFGGRRNIVINGNQTIAQRGTGAVTANVSFPVDRWQITNSSGASISVQQNSDVPTGEGFAFCTKYTVTSADSGVTGTEDALFRQHIEGQNITQLAWGTSSAKTVTISFWVKSSLTGTFGGALKNSGNTRAYPFTYTISSASTWEYKTITIAGDTSGTWLTTNGIGIRLVFSMGSGSDRLGTAGAWNSNNNDGATGQVQVVETLNATWQITGVQMEIGSLATPFEHRSFGEELALCQRYAVAFDADGSIDNYSPIGIGRWNSATDAQIHLSLPVTMRYPPTLDSTNTTAVGTFFINTAGGLGGAVPTSITLTERSYNSALLNVNYSTGGQSAGTGTSLYSDNADVAKVFLTSEL